MALMLGEGALGHAPAGRFNIELPRERLLLWEPFRRRMRAKLGDELVLDSRRGMMLYEFGRLPRCYFPLDDVRMDLLEPNGQTRQSLLTGESVYWRLRAGERVVEHAALSHIETPENAPDLDGYVSLFWNALDEWFEEDKPAFVHVRDPYHRVDALPTSLPVRVLLAGEVVAETEQAKVIYETGLPARWYIPVADVTVELQPTELETACAYKGQASYWSARAGGELHENIAWTYRAPEDDVAVVADHVAFFNERVEIEVGGELEPRVWTPWAEEGWWLRVHETVAEL